MSLRAWRRGSTLIEILIAVVILGILANMVVMQYVEAQSNARDAALHSQLRMLREQIEVYRTRYGKDPKLVAKQWDDLVTTRLILKSPVNPLNNLSNVRGAAPAVAGWVWRPKPGGGGKQLYATDTTGTALYPE